MNKYIIPICDIGYSKVYNMIISARSLAECKEKLITSIASKYDLDEVMDLNEFIKIADKSDILIGKIQDIEEI